MLVPVMKLQFSALYNFLAIVLALLSKVYMRNRVWQNEPLHGDGISCPAGKRKNDVPVEEMVCRL